MALINHRLFIDGRGEREESGVRINRPLAVKAGRHARRPYNLMQKQRQNHVL